MTTLYLANIEKRFALSLQLFSKATEMISGVFKSVSPVNNSQPSLPCLSYSCEPTCLCIQTPTPSSLVDKDKGDYSSPYVNAI
ncbi:hypothetical protein E2C01_011818 [Portunus trituberculatus]|uniref:Uncharacterized protein n=1 Tax=Portunus trituberculatus TaxID=210409 RepID=A0A5B7DCG4_PORTR|nr:hypothetical protein [Portunus trituberculatus]